jgi:hypothetical protein
MGLLLPFSLPMMVKSGHFYNVNGQGIGMAEDQSELLQQLTTRFIELGNAIKDEGVDLGVVSAAMMSASSFYATYAIAGDNGVLSDEGVAKVTEAYGGTLQKVQDYKRDEAGKQA